VKRRWSVPRQAYTPRVWPLMLANVVVTYPAVYFGYALIGSWVLAGPLVLAYVSPTVRWKIWNRRHPIVTDFVTEQRRVARWQ
jgi:hypothetical protein